MYGRFLRMGVNSARAAMLAVQAETYRECLESSAMPARFCSRLIQRILPGRYCATSERNAAAWLDLAKPVEAARLACRVTSSESPTNSASCSPRSRANAIAQSRACHSASVFDPVPKSSKNCGSPRTTTAASIRPGLGRQPPSKNTFSLRFMTASVSPQSRAARPAKLPPSGLRFTRTGRVAPF